MYCPNCRTEYRAGFKVCADCDVALVEELPQEHSTETPEGVVSVWTGDDDRLRAEACTALEGAGIEPHPVSREDHLIKPSEFPRFEIYVAADLAAKAKEVLDEKVASAEEWDALEASGALELPEEDNLPNISHSPRDERDWNPEDATAEIWSGEDLELAHMIASSLRENQINSRIEKASEHAEASKTDKLRRVFVLPEDQKRGLEIIREIVDASPL